MDSMPCSDWLERERGGGGQQYLVLWGDGTEDWAPARDIEKEPDLLHAFEKSLWIFLFLCLIKFFCSYKCFYFCASAGIYILHKLLRYIAVQGGPGDIVIYGTPRLIGGFNSHFDFTFFGLTRVHVCINTSPIWTPVLFGCRPYLGVMPALFRYNTCPIWAPALFTYKFNFECGKFKVWSKSPSAGHRSALIERARRRQVTSEVFGWAGELGANF